MAVEAEVFPGWFTFFSVTLCLLSGDSDHQPQPFDFLVDGELVRMPLEQFLLAKGISAVIFFFFLVIIFPSVVLFFLA